MTMSTKTTKTNTTKTNKTTTERLEVMYNTLQTATCKRDMVNVLNQYGYRTNTTPTTTPNKNDLYIQLFDKSRILFTSKSLKVYTNDENAKNINALDDTFKFDMVNDGSYRTKRATVSNNYDNFKKVWSYFENNQMIDYLPQTV